MEVTTLYNFMEKYVEEEPVIAPTLELAAQNLQETMNYIFPFCFEER